MGEGITPTGVIGVEVGVPLARLPFVCAFGFPSFSLSTASAEKNKCISKA